jgi:putative holliday junction resolvase
MLATPLVTLDRESSVDQLVALVAEHEVVEVVLGLPKTLAGRHGSAADIALEYAGVLRERLGVPVRLVDERLTTVTASRVLAERGVRGRRQRAVVDQAAAVEILQAWLDTRAAALACAPDEEEQ